MISKKLLTLLFPSIIEDEIVDANLDDCSKGILGELKTLQSTDIAKIIKRFGDLNAPYDWEIKNNSLTSGNVAETDRRNNVQTFDYVTDIDSDYVNQATKIAIARTLLHEMLHAYFISHIDDVNAGYQGDIRQFLLLWQYIRKNKPPVTSSEPAQHEYMANKFIPPLKDALKEFDNASQSNQYYEDLAWGALYNTEYI